MTLGNLFLAWKPHAVEQNPNHFHVDDLESMFIDTDTLFRLLELINQPIPCGLLLGLCSDANLEDFRTSLLLDHTEHNGASSTDRGLLATDFKSTLLLALMTYRESNDWLAQHQPSLLDGLEHMEFEEPRCRIVWEWIVSCRLVTHPMYTRSWLNLLSRRSIEDMGGFERWMAFVERYLPPLFTTHSEIPLNDVLDIFRQLCLLDLEPSQLRLRTRVKSIFVAVSRPGFISEMLRWRMDSSNFPLSGAAIVESDGLISSFNRITGGVDDTIVRELQWISFLDPAVVVKMFVSELCHANEPEILVNALESTYFGLERHEPFKILLESLLVAEFRTIMLERGSDRFPLALAALKYLHSKHTQDTSSVSFLSPLCATHQLAIPTMETTLAGGCSSVPSQPAGSSSATSSKESSKSCSSLHSSSITLLRQSLMLLLCELKALPAAPDDSRPDIATVRCVLKCDSLFGDTRDARMWALSELTEAAIKELERISPIPSLLAKCPSSVSSLVTSEIAWTTLIKARSFLWSPSDLNMEALIPRHVYAFISSQPCQDDITFQPPVALDLVYAASSCEHLSCLVAKSLENRTAELRGARRRLIQHLLMASTCVLPRLTAGGTELFVDGILLPLASWPEAKCQWEEHVSEVPLVNAELRPLRAASLLCSIVRALIGDRELRALRIHGMTSETELEGSWNVLQSVLRTLQRRWQLSVDGTDPQPVRSVVPLLLLTYIVVTCLWIPMLEWNREDGPKSDWHASRVGGGMLLVDLFLINLVTCLKRFSVVAQWSEIRVLELRSAIIDSIKGALSAVPEEERAPLVALGPLLALLG